jgi:hypothetical protein
MSLRRSLVETLGAVLVASVAMARVDDWGVVQPPGEDEVQESSGCCPVDGQMFPVGLWDLTDWPTCPIHKMPLDPC